MSADVTRVRACASGPADVIDDQVVVTAGIGSDWAGVADIVISDESVRAGEAERWITAALARHPGSMAVAAATTEPAYIVGVRDGTVARFIPANADDACGLLACASFVHLWYGAAGLPLAALDSVSFAVLVTAPGLRRYITLRAGRFELGET